MNGYKFFYEEDWTNNLKKIENFDEIPQTFEIWLRLLGPLIHTDLKFFSRICRLSKISIKEVNIFSLVFKFFSGQAHQKAMIMFLNLKLINGL